MSRAVDVHPRSFHPVDCAFPACLPSHGRSMQSQIGVSRVIVVVLDGLRPDAIGRFRLGAMAELMSSGAWTLDATTVRPSVTVAAITSLLTGVSPDTHGLKGDRVFIPRAAAELV